MFGLIAPAGPIYAGIKSLILKKKVLVYDSIVDLTSQKGAPPPALRCRRELPQNNLLSGDYQEREEKIDEVIILSLWFIGIPWPAYSSP